MGLKSFNSEMTALDQYWTKRGSEVYRTYHRYPMQTEKFQPNVKRIMSNTRFTEFPTLSVDPRLVISLSASESESLITFLLLEK